MATSNIKDVNEIERLRLEFDQEKFQQTHGLEKFKTIWVSIVVALGIAVVTAGASVTVSKISANSKSQELALQEFKQSQEYLNQFVTHALDQDLQRRIDFSQYVASVALSKPVATVWAKYHKKMEAEYAETRDDLRKKVVQLQSLRAEREIKNTDQRIRLEQEIRSLQRKISGNARSRAETLDQLNLVMLKILEDKDARRKYLTVFNDIRVKMGILSNDLGDSEQRSKDEFRAQLDQNGCFKDASGIEHCDKTYFQDGCFRFNDGETHCDNF